MLKQSGYEITVINGGCRGYKSSQELVKLLRDVLPMKPDVVISYTGVNDASENRRTKEYDKFPFLNSYQICLEEAIARNVKYEHSVLEVDKNYTLGVESGISRAERFIYNVKAMNGICNEFGIRYLAFLQPCLSLKQGGWSIYEQELLISTEMKQADFDYVNEFYEMVKKTPIECLKDISNLFHHYDDVYYDECHVTEKGNEIIAKCIYEVLVRERIV